MSVQEILYLRCSLGHKNGGFRAPEGLPNENEFFSEDYANYGNKILAAIVHFQKRSIRCNLEIANIWIEGYGV